MVETSVMARRIIGGVSEAEEADYTKRLEDEARKRERGIYPRTIFIALGGTGAKALMHLRRMVIERFGGLDSLEGVAYLSIDTDVRSQEPSPEEEKKSPLDKAISFAKDERINVRFTSKTTSAPTSSIIPRFASGGTKRHCLTPSSIWRSGPARSASSPAWPSSPIVMRSRKASAAPIAR